MAIQSTKGSEFHMEKASAAPETPTITAITKAKPAVVTVDAIGSLEENGVITITGSDYLTLDGEHYIINNISGNTFELTGSDTTNEAAALNVGTVACECLKASDLQLLSPSNFDPAAGTATDIPIGTFPNPEATLPGITPAGSYTLGGFVDTADVGYAELQLAEADGAPRILRILVKGQGYMVASIYVAANTPGIPLEGAPTTSFTGTFNKRLTHRYNKP